MTHQTAVPAVNHRTNNTLIRLSAMLYSVACYFLGVAALVYLILFIADLIVPVTINSASPLAPDLQGASAVMWNILLIVLWGTQHSVMARPAFKRWWTRFVPAPVERATYLVFVLLATAMLVLLWVPLPSLIWNLDGTTVGALILGIYFFGWVLVLFATFLINHFHLFGLEQAYRFITRTQSKKETFKTPLLYKLVRHPMMTGVLIAVWAAPDMTVGRLVFTLAMTLYVFVGLYFEERTLVDELGAEYAEYQRTTPSVIPRISLSRPESTTITHPTQGD